jgi:hypothetical protein
MTFPHVFEMISYGSLAAAALAVIVFRWLWRRGKKLQEP